MSVKRLLRSPFLWVSVLVLVGLGIAAILTLGEDPEELSYDEFLTRLEGGEIRTYEDFSADERLEGELDGDADEADTYVTHYNPELNGEELSQALVEARQDGRVERAEVDTQASAALWQTLAQFLPLLLIFGLFFFLVTQMQGGGGRMMGFGKAKAKTVTKDTPTVTFGDVAGAAEAVEDLKEIRDFLSDPARFQAIGAEIPRGVLLVGPPGTGKTLLARAVAGEAGVPFFSISGSDFVEMYVGVGASRVRDLFEQAKEAAPAIVFMDEIDAVGRHRGAGMGGGHDEREQTLNQLLVEMDGFDATTGVILIAATNRPDILDPALLRPGRFDRQVTVDHPDLEGRQRILEVHARGKPLADDADLAVIARRTPGFTGADLANLVNEAALLSARRGEVEISMHTLEASIDRVIGGPERARVMSDTERRTIAYHEGGHTIVGHALPHADPVHKVSIIPRGQALGWTLSLPTEDRYLVSRGELIDRLAMMLGGRVAEELTIGDYTTGASNDIAKATATARDMVTQYGMSEQLGPLKLGGGDGQPFLGRDYGHERDYSPEVAAEIDREIRVLVDQAHDEALEILAANRAVLEELAGALMDHETVEGEELAAILGRVQPRPSRKLPAMGHGDGAGSGNGVPVSHLRRLDPGLTDSVNRTSDQGSPRGRGEGPGA
ncbi:ATP-dependent metallopeptidase FtsH/Yme1/Tma family protein [Egibacter rhizosphaerae]|uniref:ATP-dependent zinc metalloprotease FtsH n=1 Tax=Egibacter rhizosphaerae TaxID=1670831 RepID=A0A411YDL2_9ACTN|nr:ATP-dependent zinc metalloprotease FtsH [Egibacter rhizosphaerae]QBI19278.1 ATP-dependent metallopeptidase FtsH/Yme1/Tma family protein [Egibacter rhizosphaerae]